MKMAILDRDAKIEDLEETPREKALKAIVFDLECKNSFLKLENESLRKNLKWTVNFRAKILNEIDKTYKRNFRDHTIYSMGFIDALNWVLGVVTNWEDWQ